MSNYKSRYCNNEICVKRIKCLKCEVDIVAICIDFISVSE